jgi:hypothetical protein
MLRLITHENNTDKKQKTDQKRQADCRFFEFEEGKQQTEIGKTHRFIPRYFR